MQRVTTLVVAWLLAAVVATTAAWQGVTLVTEEVTDDDRPAALAASDVRDALDDPGSPSSTTTTTASRPASTAGATTTTGPPAPAPETKTYRLEGGTVTIAFSPAGVTATAVSPNPGFGVDRNGPEDGGWRVELESDGHRSRLDAWWDGGPQVRPREDPR